MSQNQTFIVEYHQNVFQYSDGRKRITPIFIQTVDTDNYKRKRTKFLNQTTNKVLTQVIYISQPYEWTPHEIKPKVEVKDECKPMIKCETKDVKLFPKIECKTEFKNEIKYEVKYEIKYEVKYEVKPVLKYELKSEGIKAEVSSMKKYFSESFELTSIPKRLEICDNLIECQKTDSVCDSDIKILSDDEVIDEVMDVYNEEEVVEEVRNKQTKDSTEPHLSSFSIASDIFSTSDPFLNASDSVADIVSETVNQLIDGFTTEVNGLSKEIIIESCAQFSSEEWIRRDAQNSTGNDISMVSKQLATSVGSETEKYYNDSTATEIEDLPFDEIVATNTFPEELPQITSVYTSVNIRMDPKTLPLNESKKKSQKRPKDKSKKLSISTKKKKVRKLTKGDNSHPLVDIPSTSEKHQISFESKECLKRNEYILESTAEEAADPIPKDIDNNTNSDKHFNNRCIKRWIAIGKQVVSRWTDGLFYNGLIQKIDINSNKCLILFEDNSLHWIRFEDLHKQLTSDESDFYCAICSDGTSDAPNAIVICDVCNNGYHQSCHKPCIGDEILEPNIPFTCRLCVFALATQKGGAVKGDIGEVLQQMKMEFPYDLNGLDWDDCHQTNSQRKYCYCGGDGIYYSKMLQCCSCRQWFHEACIQALESPLLFGDHYYTFKCSVCAKGREQLTKRIMSLTDVIALVINNLALQHKKQRFFGLTTDIVPFIRKNSNRLKTLEFIQKLSERELKGRISAILKSCGNRFINGSEVHKSADHWALQMPFPFEKPLILAPLLATHSSSTLTPVSSPIEPQMPQKVKPNERSQH